jgi:TonB family protein
MSTTQIPPRGSIVSGHPPERPPEHELYDAQRWESAYRDAVPQLLVQLQDDLSRSRMREAFWISVVVHLAVVIVLWNSQRIAGWFPHRAVLLVSSNNSTRGKELTYLELPPDEQQVTNRSDSDIISDKNRRAMSKKPQLDAKELKKLISPAPPGPPGVPGPSTPKPQPSSPPVQAQNAPPQPQQQQQAQQQAQAAPPPASNNQTAKLQMPQNVFGGPMSTTSSLEQATRAAAASRGGGGAGGDYGLGQGRQPTAAVGNLDVLSDTMGVDFGPYLQRVLHDVRQNWYNVIPEAAQAPIMKKGKVTIEFAILKDGRVAGLQRVATSGDVALDRAAWAGITASNPFPPLPSQFGGQYLALRFHFYYNPDKADLE